MLQGLKLEIKGKMWSEICNFAWNHDDFAGNIASGVSIIVVLIATKKPRPPIIIVFKSNVPYSGRGSKRQRDQRAKQYMDKTNTKLLDSRETENKTIENKDMKVGSRHFWGYT